MTWHIGELLIQKKLISWQQLEEALDEQKKTKEMTGQILVRKGYLSESLLYKTLAEQNRTRFVDLKRTRINPKAVEMVPKNFAQKHSVMPIEFHGGRLTVGIPNPMHIWPKSELEKIPMIQGIQTVLCLPKDVEMSINQYYDGD